MKRILRKYWYFFGLALILIIIIIGSIINSKDANLKEYLQTKNFVDNYKNELQLENIDENDDKTRHENNMLFPIGKPNDGFAQYFVGQSYLAPISTSQVGIYNVTFEPKCRNYWHIHHADKGGGQILICIAGQGYYQEWGKDAVLMRAGDVINIPVGVKHWHGATADSWFSHLAIEVPGENCSNEWLEAVKDDEYNKLNKRSIQL